MYAIAEFLFSFRSTNTFQAGEYTKKKTCFNSHEASFAVIYTHRILFAEFFLFFFLLGILRLEEKSLFHLRSPLSSRNDFLFLFSSRFVHQFVRSNCASMVNQMLIGGRRLFGRLCRLLTTNTRDCLFWYFFYVQAG